MYTLGAGRIFIKKKSIIIVCLLNLIAWKASWAHRTDENEEKKDNDKIIKKNRSKRRAPVVLSCTHNLCFEQNMKIVKKIQLKIIVFTALKNHCKSHRRVFVM